MVNIEVIRSIKWINCNSYIASMLQWLTEDNLIPVVPGQEATVIGIGYEVPQFVLKIWDKEVTTDAKRQYEQHHILLNSGLNVPEVLGWGVNQLGHEVLAMTYHGRPIVQRPWEHTEAFAHALVKLHQLSGHPCALFKTKYDPHNQGQESYYSYTSLVHHFFPFIEQHPDINSLVAAITKELPPPILTMTHGDYTLENFLYQHQRYTIIDWTSAQLQDFRYDFAWASFLLYLYHGKQIYERFKDIYLQHHYIDTVTLSRFEMLAALRWLLLDRLISFPEKDKIQYVWAFIFQKANHSKDLLKR
ncbi:phosphotransferase [Caldalkalibacillus salinus]|uniref:phosphotransferase n=1 Tax=Caldalkalibacillus salinus TaxID=2803787 RepID=UPI00192160F8|nr:phosphotransferase [Caldalkalibacillus salinus]